MYPQPTTIRRLMSRVTIENDGSTKHSANSSIKYKPPFVIDFKNDKFEIYRFTSKRMFVFLFVALLVAGYATYQLTVKWSQNGKLKSIVCVWMFLVGLLSLGILAKLGNATIRKIDLLRDGKAIRVKKMFSLKGVKIAMADMDIKTEKAKEINEMLDVKFFSYRQKLYGLPNLQEDQAVYPDIELLNAVFDGVEIDVADSGEHPTITL